MKKLTKLKWRAVIDGEEYGANLIEIDADTNAKIKDVVEVMAEQMIATLQKVITGKNDYDVMQEEADKNFYERVGIKKGE